MLDEVKQYTFEGKQVYCLQMDPEVADGTTEVLDENCNHIGLLGGIAGNHQINGVDFSSATLVKSIWKKIITFKTNTKKTKL